MMNFIKNIIKSSTSLKNIILFQVTSVFAICLTILSSYSWYQNIHSIEKFSSKLATDYTHNFSSSIEKNIKQSISSTDFFKNWIKNIEKNGKIIPNDDDFFYVMSTALKNVSGVSAIYIADLYGNFKQLRRNNESFETFQKSNKRIPLNAEFTLRKINKNKNIKNEYWTYMNENGKKLALEKNDIVTYDPRKRPWFKKSIISKGKVLSDVYQFGTIKNLIMTVSMPIMNKSKIIGILGIDIDIRSLSIFLQSNKPTKNSSLFVVDENNYIIASSNKNSPMIKVDGRAKIVNFKDIKNKPPLWDVMKEKKISQSDSFIFNDSDSKYNVATVQMSDEFQRNIKKKWFILTIIPHNELMGAFLDNKSYNIIIYLFIYAIVIGQIVILARSISDPVDEITREARRIKKFDFLNKLQVDSNISEVQILANTIETMKLSLRSFTRYMPKRLVQKLLEKNEDIKLGGDTKNLTIFFSDVAGFTTVSEAMEPQELMIHLSDYFENLTDIIINQDGTIDKYIGDAIMAFWGAPDNFKNKSYAACKSALLCQDKLKQLNEKWILDGKPPLPTRMGIHNSDVVVGNMGSSERMNYTAIGDGVNMAARLEGINKFYETNILISSSVYDDVKNHFICRSLDIVAVKGKNEGIRIYELICDINDVKKVSKDLIDFSEEFSKAHEFYLKLNFQSALKIFKSIKYKHSTIDMYIKRCNEYINNPPDESNWDGIYRFTKK